MKRSVHSLKPKPVWALRLGLAFAQANLVNSKGDVDKTRVGERFSVGPKAVEHWLNGEHQPRYEVLIEICRMTGLSVDWILGIEDATPVRK